MTKRRPQRSRERLPPGTSCYLCGKTITADETWNPDHVPPRGIFATALRTQFDPQLEWLYTHAGCNGDYQKDEDYFVVSLAGHVQQPAAQAVFRDLKAAAEKAHSIGLIKDAIGRFGRVESANGELLYTWERARVHRFLWKIARGLYTLETDRLLPERPLGHIRILPPNQGPEDLADITWFPAVRDTEPMGTYGKVFDYKWLGWKEGELRAHAFAMLFWDGLLVVLLFHDPLCRCGQCGPVESTPERN